MRKECDLVKFFGKVTASMSHELKNVFAIIQESLGLMQDILSLPELENIPRKDRLEAVLLKLSDHVDKGVTLVGYLSRLAHIPDQDVEEKNLADMVDLVVALTERLARLGQVELNLENQALSSLKVKTRPVDLLAALFYAIESCLSLLHPGSSITLKPQHIKDWKGFRICCVPYEIEAAEFTKAIKSLGTWPLIEETMEKLNGRAYVDASPPQVILEVKELPWNV